MHRMPDFNTSVFDTKSNRCMSVSSPQHFRDCIPSPLTWPNVSLCACVRQELTICTRGHATTSVVRWPPGRSCDPRLTQPACLLLQSQVRIVHAGQQHQLGLHTVSLSRESCNYHSLLTVSFVVLSFLALCACFWCAHISPTVFQAVSLLGEKKHQPLTQWQGHRFHFKSTAP